MSDASQVTSENQRISAKGDPMSEEEKDLENGEEEREGEEDNGNGQGDKKPSFKIADHVINLHPEKRQRIVNLVILSSRMRFLKWQ